MKTYIILGAAGGYISGAPIYQRNKAMYMKEQGWNVYYISTCHGKVYVKGLEQFIVATCTFLCKEAYVYPRNKQKELIQYIIKKIPLIGKNSEIVIESGTYYTAYWGELLAKELKAKHIVVYLDEKNDGFNKRQADFFKFKFKRHELACIKEETMIKIFSPFWSIDENNAIGLPCFCTNSVEDYQSDITNNIVISDYNIGYIGRLEKNVFKVISKAIIDFANLYPDKNISFICFGGAEDIIIQHIKQSFQDIKNITLYISGYIFPIPLNAIKRCDFYISSAGSCSVSIKAGIPTLKINVYTEQPEGIMKIIRDKEPIKCPFGNTILNYIEMFFINKLDIHIKPVEINIEKELMKNCLDKHILFLDKTSPNNEYYDIGKIQCSFYQKICKFLIAILGNRIVKYLNI